MAYYIFHIPSRNIPNSLTEINESVYCFPSKEININSDYGLSRNCLCLVINADSDFNVDRTIRDFIIVLNIFGQNHESVKWFSGQSLPSQKKINDSIENIYSQYKSDVRYLMTHFDYSDMPLLLLMSEPPKYSFIEIFNRFHNLIETDFLYKSFSYLAIVNPIIMITQKIFNNALFENALQFQLFESIMNKYDTTPKEENEPCPKCKHKGQRGIRKRIDDFFNQEEYSRLKYKPDVIASVRAIYESRNKFSHFLEGKSRNAYHEENLIPNLGSDSTFHLYDDIKYADGTHSAIYTLKSLNTLILIGKLLDK